jgi:hypothetical protein
MVTDKKYPIRGILIWRKILYGHGIYLGSLTGRGV